jgi:hypothetical protein
MVRSMTLSGLLFEFEASTCARVALAMESRSSTQSSFLAAHGLLAALRDPHMDDFEPRVTHSRILLASVSLLS